MKTIQTAYIITTWSREAYIICSIVDTCFNGNIELLQVTSSHLSLHILIKYKVKISSPAILWIQQTAQFIVLVHPFLHQQS